MAATSVSTTGLLWLSSTEGRFTPPSDVRTTWRQVGTMVYAAQPHEIRSFWTTFPWYDNTWVINASGDTLQRSDYANITAQTLGDLNIRPDGDGNYVFTNPCKSDPFRLRTSQLKQLVEWLQIMILNWGFHLSDPGSWTIDRAYSVNAHPVFDQYDWRFCGTPSPSGHHLIGRRLIEKWRVRAATAGGSSSINARVKSWGSAVQFESAAGHPAVHADLQELQDDTFGAVILAGHPALQHGPAMLKPKSRYTTTPATTDLKHGLTVASSVRRRRASALELLFKRLQSTSDRDPELQAALRDRPFTTLTTRADGETAYQLTFRYRLTLGALNLRSNTGDKLGCPQTRCSGQANESTVTHILWTCAAAQRTWRLVHAQRTRRPNPVDPECMLQRSLGSDRPVVARGIRLRLQDDGLEQATIAIATQAVWTIAHAVVPHQLWLHRNATAFNGAAESVHEITAKVWKTFTNQVASLAAAKRTSSITYEIGTAMDIILRELEADATIEPEHPLEVRVYYDGGARGNPGPSGAGSLLIERSRPTDPWLLVWWSAQYLGDSSTNNVAEQTALANGLREAAARFGDEPVAAVIGDSMLATRQLQDCVRVKSQRFQEPLHTSRTALLTLYDFRRLHTYRTGNKSADWLANWAMNERRSTTSSTADAATS